MSNMEIEPNGADQVALSQADAAIAASGSDTSEEDDPFQTEEGFCHQGFVPSGTRNYNAHRRLRGNNAALNAGMPRVTRASGNTTSVSTVSPVSA